MFKIFDTIKQIKKLKEIKPEEAWLKKEKARFAFTNKSSVNFRNEKQKNFGLFYRRKFVSSALAVLLLVALTTGTINSAQAALPDDILYPVKLLAEKFQGFVIVGSENRVDFALKLAEKRLDEADKADAENIVVGSIERAESKVKEASFLLEEISLSKNRGPNSAEKIEKAVARIEKLEEKKNHLALKFKKDLPKAAKALEKLGAVSVDINKNENKIILTFEFNSATTSTSTPPKTDDDDNRNKNKQDNHGKDKIIELLTDGAGKSGKTPPGLWNAPGIRKKLADFFDFETGERKEDNKDDDEHDNDDDDENDDNDDPTDKTAPVISSLSTSSIASTSAMVSWVTSEPATGKVYYSSSSPVNFSTANSKATTTLSVNHTFNLTGLVASTTYYYIVESADTAENKASSTQKTFTTQN